MMPFFAKKVTLGRRATGALILALSLVGTACDQATNITAPQDRGPLAFALTPERIAELLDIVDGEVLPTEGTAQPGNGDEVAVMLSLPAPNEQQHYLFVESRAVDVSTVFTMGVGSVTLDGQTVHFIDLNATATGSTDTNDVGRTGFPTESVVLCMAEPDGVDSPQIYWLADANTVVQMTRVVRGDMPAHVCAELPHFSGFVMGAN